MTTRRDFLNRSLALGASAFAPSVFWSCGNDDPLIIGHGEYRYRIIPDWGKQDASKFPVQDCHEMVQTENGDLYLLTNHTRNNILVYSLDGKIKNAWGTVFPGAHGLTLFDENGSEVLWITDYERHQVFKMTLDGQLLLTIDAPQDVLAYKDPTNFKPTETAIASDGSIYIADGYGAQHILHYDPNGQLLNVFGGYGTEAHLFQNAHGICIDDRKKDSPTLLITAREQQAVKRFSLEGKHLETISLPGAYICRPVIHNEQCYFSVLKSKGVGNADSGFVLIMDQNDQVVSCPGATFDSENKADFLYHQTMRVFQYPHDVCVDRDENLYVAQWNSGNTYPIKLVRV